MFPFYKGSSLWVEEALMTAISCSIGRDRWSGSQGCHQIAGSERGGVWALIAILRGKTPEATCPLSSSQQEVWLHMENKVTFPWSSNGSPLWRASMVSIL